MREAEFYIRANQAISAVVADLTPEQWDKRVPATPKWTVRELINHIAHTAAAFTTQLGGEKFDGEDLLGSEPAASWAEIATASEDAAENVTDESLANAIAVQACDRTIHLWDLQGAIGADQTMDPQLAEFAYDTMLPNADMLAASDVFGPRIPVPDDADVSAKLLGLTGRDPGVSGGDIHMSTGNIHST